MNAYMAREEKDQFIRLMCLQVILQQAVDTYSELASTDKMFLGELRHARTRLDKAMTMRQAALGEEEKAKLEKQAKKLNLMFLPTPEAKKEHEQMLALKSTLPIDVQDFQDWYEAVIETTCKTCRNAEFEECTIRRVLDKYGVFPVDPEAQGKCQYSYVGDGAPADPEEEPSETAEVLNENPSTMRAEVGFVSGKKFIFDVSEALAKEMLQEMRRHNRQSRGICATHVGDVLVAIDMQEVVAFVVPGVENGSWEAELQPAAAEGPKERPWYHVPYTEEKELYQIECRCGAEYVATMNAGRLKARCRDCNASIFADRSFGGVDVDGKQATLLTNRYWVERTGEAAPIVTQEPAPSQEKPEPPCGSTYRDPCDPFAKGA